MPDDVRGNARSEPFHIGSLFAFAFHDPANRRPLSAIVSEYRLPRLEVLVQKIVVLGLESGACRFTQALGGQLLTLVNQ